MDTTASVKSGSYLGSNASSGTKRKRAAGPKFYAVRVGHKPGVYYTWNDCLQQVTGFKKSSYKSFTTLTDAERFVAGEDPSKDSTSLSPTKFYAVKSGRQPGIYTDYETVQAQITGWQKPRHKSFSTKSEAQRYLDEETPTSPAMPDKHAIELTNFINSMAYDGSKDTGAESRPAKKTKKATNATIAPKPKYSGSTEADFEPGFGPLPPGAEDGFDPTVVLDPKTGGLKYKTVEQRQAMKPRPGTGSMTEPIRIYTDGSCFGNGKAGAHAGVGVYFGPRDKRNVSEPLAGPRQTNQRAELTALQRALEIAPRNRNITVYSDSNYAIHCVTDWCANWRKNGWKSATGKAVENKDLIENILGKIQERINLNIRTDFEWVKAHAGLEGNEEADRLAAEGARSGLH